jgi:hypothetical protein
MDMVVSTNTSALFTILCLAVLLFPIGILFLLCLPFVREFRCPYCQYVCT